MKGDSQSVHNVHEVGRLLRLEKLRSDFYRTITNIAIFALFIIIVYIWFIVNNNSQDIVADPLLGKIRGHGREIDLVIPTFKSRFIAILKKYSDQIFQCTYAIGILLLTWLCIGTCSWMMTPKESALNHSQLKKLGLSGVKIQHVSKPEETLIPAAKNANIFQSSRIQNTEKVPALTSPAPQKQVSFIGDKEGFLSRAPSTNSLLSTWYPASPATATTAAVSTTPQWQQYHSSPISKSDYTMSPSLVDELNTVGRCFDGFSALRVSQLCVDDDHRSSLKRCLIHYLQDVVRRFDFVADRIVDALIASGKLAPFGLDKSSALQILALRESSTARLSDLLNICKDVFLTQSYNRSPQHVEMMVEYICLLFIFDYSSLASRSHILDMSNLKSNEVRRYVQDPRVFERGIYDDNKIDISEPEILLLAFFHLLDFSRGTQSEMEMIVYGFFRLVDPSRVTPRFSNQRYADGATMLPRFPSISSPPFHYHSPNTRGLLNIGGIVSKAGHQVGILCQKKRENMLRNIPEYPHLSLFIPPGPGHAFLSILAVEKGRQNCLTALILFLLFFYQSAQGADVHVSSNITSIVTKLLTEVFSVPDATSLKTVLARIGMTV